MAEAIVLILGSFALIVSAIGARVLVRRELRRREAARPLSEYQKARERWMLTGDPDAKDVMYREYDPNLDDRE